MEEISGPSGELYRQPAPGNINLSYLFYGSLYNFQYCVPGYCNKRIKPVTAAPRKEVREMTKFEALKCITDVTKFSEFAYDVLCPMKSAEEIAELLSEEVSENGLQTLKSIAQDGYPLCLDGQQ